MTPERLREGWGYLSEHASSPASEERACVLRRMRDMIDELLPPPVRKQGNVTFRVSRVPRRPRPLVHGWRHTVEPFAVRRERVGPPDPSTIRRKPRRRNGTRTTVIPYGAARAPPPAPTV